MENPFINASILARLDELIHEGEQQWWDFQKDPKLIKDPVRFTQWTTSCLNLLDKLSITTNRFVTEFEEWAKRGSGKVINLGASVGVLKAAREEYIRGLAIDYHLSVSAAVFSNLISQAEYLIHKGYHIAAAVIAGAALEEGLKARARASGIEVEPRDTLMPVVHKLKANSILNEFQAKNIEALGDIRNKAAHGGEFPYKVEDVRIMQEGVAEVLSFILSRS